MRSRLSHNFWMAILPHNQFPYNWSIIGLILLHFIILYLVHWGAKLPTPPSHYYYLYHHYYDFNYLYMCSILCKIELVCITVVVFFIPYFFKSSLKTTDVLARLSYIIEVTVSHWRPYCCPGLWSNDVSCIQLWNS